MGKPYERPVAPDEAKQGAAEAVEAAREPEAPSLLDEPRREDLAPCQPKRSALGTSRADGVTGKGARSFGNPRPESRSGFTNDPGGSSSLGGSSETKKNAFNPGDMAKFTAPGERERYAAEQAVAAPTNGKRPDAALADAISPQMGFGFDVEVVGAKPPGLADKFVAPPFSVLDTRAGYWQDRRRAWLSIGFRGETSATHDYVPDTGNSKRAPSGVYGGAGGAPAPLKQALNTSAGEHEADGSAVAARHHDEQAMRGASGAKRTAIHTGPNQKHADRGGRAQGLIYGHDAPASDPGFYDKKRATEQRLGREISTEEFKRDHYNRDEAMEGQSESVKTGTSVFDPVLCEVAYRWFSGEGAQVLDPFAGGVVRGAVAAILGRRYWGCELRPEQIADNRRQAEALFGPGGPDFGREPEVPVWQEGDSTRLAEYEPPAADLVFTCPPYGSLEVYSDDPRDLSTMTYERFRDGLFAAMKASADALNPNRFAVWVVGEFRDKAGMEVGFVSDTVQLAMMCGLRPYNSAILLNSVGSAALRAQMILKSRKLTRVHQHVLVFCKGDPKKAAAACGSAEVDV